MTLKELLAKFRKAAKENPDTLLVLNGLWLELEKVIHPSTVNEKDIEAKLDADYEQILKDNKSSKGFKALGGLVLELLQVAAAKNGLKL